ncbi:Hydantoinase B/oxoprolinase [Suillus discolor]|uniref:Hydantoinase B/oxoprolinase n=1 Tax=Suillus discolor TaxID=1912936 RepID=A0A9P7F964_9AGAM|nr:Hydantoinase B/oxoprolinase [Suillus discolor]KAG2108971.1 Hydantoinase B/oxoprolinase [Suillus discolor]
MAITKPSSGPDPILLTLFANRFMSVAEAMGRSLQQTSISTNIKERLDFSCALFAPDGDLVANAPFIPIHLGSMSFAELKDGDVLMTNSPHAGGSYSFDKGTNEIIFFTASRGHHADIGGILPGSMPPTSVNIFEEGAEIVSLKIVNDGMFDKKGLYEYMVEKPAQYPGSSGCRNIKDFVDDYSLETVQEYMYHIRKNAENSVRSLLRDVVKNSGTNFLSAVDYLDDGTPIQLKVEINEEEGSAVLDFEGTGCEVRGNLNAPISVVHSAVIYCMRAMLNVDIPLNAGCLVPIEIKIPKKCLLSPSRTAAVCGGNVLTSQRIVDVVLKAFHACAASQGCTNNLTFGTGGKDKDGIAIAGWGYYETIAGGSGSGPGWHGTSGVHTHITNTRIGDVEILERRYPILVHRFGLRPGSGGKGEWNGGDGVIREFEVMQGMQVSILSERRTRAPYGMAGGEPAMMGRNTWIKQRRAEDSDIPEETSEEDMGPRCINIGGKATVFMGKGDRLLIETPGGGGWGMPDEGQFETTDEHKHPWEARGSLAERAAAQAGF